MILPHIRNKIGCFQNFSTKFLNQVLKQKNPPVHAKDLHSLEHIVSLYLVMLNRTVLF